jgi:hypothetical protein
MPDYTTSDGTLVQVSEPIDSSLPLVVLLHGLSGDAAHMTNPNTGAGLGGVIFDRTARVPPVVDRGWRSYPGLGVWGFEMDGPTSVRGWRSALNAAGFATLSYSQVQPRGTLAANVAQLQRIINELLTGKPELSGLRVVFLSHSRGGILARQMLVNNASDPSLVSRVLALISLHSPHQGSGVAAKATTVDSYLLALEGVFARLGQLPPGVLTLLRGEVSSPAYPEISPGSALLAALAAAEPVAGVEYHTFGGTSTWFCRLRANLFTPGSAFPLPTPFPRFHWFTSPLQVGVMFDALSFPPLPLPVPLLSELQIYITALAALTPELRNGSGDLLVADARAHLPFSLTRTTNALNHAEALYDPGLHTQVIAILQRFRSPSPLAVTPDLSFLEPLLLSDPVPAPPPAVTPDISFLAPLLLGGPGP